MPYTHTHVWMMFDVCKYKDIHLRYLGLVVTLESSDPALPLACQCRRWPPPAGWKSENPSDFGDCGAALSFSLSEPHHFWSSHFNMQNTSDHYHDRLEKQKVQFTGCCYTRIWINHMQSTSSSLFFWNYITTFIIKGNAPPTRSIIFAGRSNPPETNV